MRRRTFIGGMGLFGAAGLLPCELVTLANAGALGPAAAAHPTRSRRQGGARKIDFHTHIHPEEYVLKTAEYYPDQVVVERDDQGRLAIGGGTGVGAIRPIWNHELRLEEMDRSGVDVGILSSTTMYNRVDAHSPELCRIVNDAIAASCRRAPDRFRGYIHVPFNDPAEMRKEIGRASALPGMVGVFITSNVGGRYLHTPDFLPFWEEVDRRRLPVFIHPTEPPGYADDDIAPLVAFPAETTLSTMKLLYSGLLERFPDLVLILAHLGGTLPFLAHRVDTGFEFEQYPAKYREIPRKPTEYMKKLYLDTALGWYRPAFDAAVALVGVDHILYGTDHFMVNSDFMDRTNAFLDGLPLSPGDRMKILSGNAERILPGV